MMVEGIRSAALQRSLSVHESLCFVPVTEAMTSSFTVFIVTLRISSQSAKMKTRGERKWTLCFVTGQRRWLMIQRITDERTLPPYIIDRRCTEGEKRQKKGRGKSLADEKARNVAVEDVLRCKDGWMDVGSCVIVDSQVMDMIRVTGRASTPVSQKENRKQPSAAAAGKCWRWLRRRRTKS